MRLVGSAHANLFNSVSAGIHALSGPLHGGANQAVLEMLGKLHESGDDPKKFMEKVKNKEDGVRLMGFGHRVYKNYDPRAAIIKKAADDILEKLGQNDPLLEIAKGLEEIALADDYFVERKLYPNVDFYTGLIYKAMGFESKMFTVLFAIGRLPGLDRPVARDDDRPRDEDRPPAPDLHRRARARPTPPEPTAPPSHWVAPSAHGLRPVPHQRGGPAAPRWGCGGARVRMPSVSAEVDRDRRAVRSGRPPVVAR